MILKWQPNRSFHKHNIFFVHTRANGKLCLFLSCCVTKRLDTGLYFSQIEYVCLSYETTAYTRMVFMKQYDKTWCVSSDLYFISCTAPLLPLPSTRHTYLLSTWHITYKNYDATNSYFIVAVWQVIKHDMCIGVHVFTERTLLNLQSHSLFVNNVRCTIKFHSRNFISVQQRTHTHARATDSTLFCHLFGEDKIAYECTLASLLRIYSLQTVMMVLCKTCF